MHVPPRRLYPGPSSTEHQMATTKRRAELGDEEPSPTSTPADEHLVDLPGVRRELISLTGKAFERTLLWKLDWWYFMHVLPLPRSSCPID